MFLDCFVATLLAMTKSRLSYRKYLSNIALDALRLRASVSGDRKFSCAPIRLGTCASSDFFGGTFGFEGNLVGIDEDLLAFRRKHKVDQQHSRVRVRGALRKHDRAGRARHDRHRLRGDGCALIGGNARMLHVDVERDRIFAGDHAIDERAGAGGEIDDLLLTQLADIGVGLLIAPGGAQIVDEQQRAAGV